MPLPNPTFVLRLIHVDNLGTCVKRGGLYAPNTPLGDGPAYRIIHDTEVQAKRHVTRVPCGAGGVVHDYVPFYFGYLSPMMLRLKTGQVTGYNEGQEPLIYLVTTAQAVQASGAQFVFSDGHGIARFTKWFDNLADLDKVDWSMVFQQYWSDNLDDPDRQRRKQAEFLVHRFCAWSLIQEIAVINDDMKQRVQAILGQFAADQRPLVSIRRAWYY